MCRYLRHAGRILRHRDVRSVGAEGAGGARRAPRSRTSADCPTLLAPQIGVNHYAETRRMPTMSGATEANPGTVRVHDGVL